MPALSVRAAATLSAASAVAFVGWTVLTMTGRLWVLDRTVLTWRLDPGSVVVQPVRVLSVLGSAEITVVGVAGLGILAAVHLLPRRDVAVLTALLVAGAVVEFVMKKRLDHPPPLGVPGGTDPHVVLLATPYSYPSGHTLRVLLLAAALAPLARRLGRPAPAVLAAGVTAVVASRVLLNQHWASDVVGGALLAAALLPWLSVRRKPATLAGSCAGPGAERV